MFKKSSHELALPEELEIKILLNLPVKSLVKFKSICKRWYSLIEDPVFERIYKENEGNKRILCYRKHPTTNTLVASLHDHENPTESNSQFLELPFLNDHEGWEFEGIKSDSDLIEEMKSFDKDIQIFGPINGTYCVFHRIFEIDSGTITLWNPTTRVYKTISPPVTFPFPIRQLFGDFFDDDDDVCGPCSLMIGFGFDDSINDYKVVVICHWELLYGHGGDDHWNVRVYNNATGLWSTICDVGLATKNPSFPFVEFYLESSNCFLNGIYHWLVSRKDRSFPKLVLAFEFASETFKLISGPPISKKLYEQYNYIDFSVWVLRKTIAVVAIFHKEKKPKKVEVWLMREYGVADSWDLLCSIAIKPLNEDFCVVGIPNDEQIYFVDSNTELISYRFDDCKVTKHDIRFDGKFVKRYGTLGVLSYVETLETVKTRLGNSKLASQNITT